jgi:hypothetical protein
MTSINAGWRFLPSTKLLEPKLRGRIEEHATSRPVGNKISRLVIGLLRVP